MQVKPDKLFAEAEKKGFALGGFNITTLEVGQAIVSGAEKAGGPCLIQTSESSIKYFGLDLILAVINNLISGSEVGLTFHLDHGRDVDLIKKVVEAGFPSVMIDGSSLPYEENVAVTRDIVDYAHKKDVWVEGELGRIAGEEDDIETLSTDNDIFTDPDQAKDFIDKTGVDMLAVGIGNQHGFYKGEPKLRFDLLKTICERIEKPIVLHGSSGLPDEDLRRAVSLGVRKVNMDTESREAFSSTLRETLKQNKEEIDPRKIIAPSREAVAELITKKIKILRNQ